MLPSATGRSVLAVLMLVAGACGGAPTPEKPPVSAGDSSSPFLNARRTDVAYVGSEACASCHGELYRGYQTHGMAHSFYRMSPEVAVEDFSDATLYHEASDLWYRMYEEDGGFYQEEYRLNEHGEKIHRLVREIEYVVGSGTAARTYLTRSNGRFYEMPVTWYTQEKRWDFSPGYDRVNQRFDRLIPDRCMACHNSYPETVEFVEGKYADVPQGIGCERCHGPGELHVDARLETAQADESIDYTIVNPAHLSLDRRLDVCQQCHLHGDVSLLREGEDPFDYRPSEPLAAHVAIFSAPVEEPGGISVISHARRMKLSACFRGSLATGEPMECTTCHNPHEGFRAEGPEYFNETCKDCHGVPDLRAAFETEEARTVHTAEANCFSCHMPKVEAEDAPHASFTDHWIRVVGDVPEVAPLLDIGDEPLVPYFEEDEGGRTARRYRGVAYIVYGLRNSSEGAYQRGIELLEDALSEDPDHGNAQFMLGYAHMQAGELEAAVPALEKAVQLNPDIPERLNALARVYEQLGRAPAEVTRLYRRALTVQPDLADVRVNYGRFLQESGDLQAAIEAYRAAAQEKPWLAIAHYNLGSSHLQRGELAAAETALQQAVKLRPDYAEALGNLGLLYAQEGRLETAHTMFQRALEAAPTSAVAHANIGTFYVNVGRHSAAAAALEQAVRLDPRYVTAHANLALAYLRLGERQQARTHAQRALQIAPGHPLARQILEAL